MKTIEEVISNLDQIIDWSIKNQNPAGYFATTYRTMTAAVLQGIKKKKFQDAERMTNLDVTFAKRYIDAFEAYQKIKNVPMLGIKLLKLVKTITYLLFSTYF